MREYKDGVYPREDETYLDYRNRIIKNKEDYELDINEISDLCKCFYNQDVPDNLKKFYAFKEAKNTDIVKPKKRILTISDCHVPFNLPARTYDKYRGKVDILVINGDLMDCYNISKFTKMYRKPLIEELISAREYILDVINRICPRQVIAIPGNHEMRLGKAIADKIGTDITDLMPTDAMAFLFDTGFNYYDHQHGTKEIYIPLDEELATSNIEVVYVDNFWSVVGKTIFVHPLSFRGSPMGTAVKAFEYFRTKGIDFDTIVMAHTHQVGYIKYGEYYLYEQGCCADLNEMRYADSRMPKTPQNNGYMYIIQNEDGSLNPEETVLETFDLT